MFGSRFSKAPRALRYMSGNATTTAATTVALPAEDEREPDVDEPLPERRVAPEREQQQEAAHSGRQHHGDGEDGIRDVLRPRGDAQAEVRGCQAQHEDEHDGRAGGLERDPQRTQVDPFEKGHERIDAGGLGRHLHLRGRHHERRVGMGERHVGRVGGIGHVGAVRADHAGIELARLELLVETVDHPVLLQLRLSGEQPLPLRRQRLAALRVGGVKGHEQTLQEGAAFGRPASKPTSCAASGGT